MEPSDRRTRARGNPACGLNPRLHRRLTREFGEVRIANEGDAMVLGSPILNRDAGRYVPNIISAGEYYRVSCKYCDDTRFRLWINHRYGTIDRDTDTLFDYLAICYNDRCLDEYENRQELAESVYGHVNRDLRLKRAGEMTQALKPGRKVDATLGPIGMPGDCVRLDRLDPGHEACRYLARRRFDPGKIGRVHGVAYCRDADPDYDLARGRLIVPIKLDGQRVGWQARYVGDIDFKSRNIPKYYTMPHFPRRLVFYNWDRARVGRALVLVEGVTDVWRVGREGIAVLGSSLSREQGRLLESWYRRTEGVLAVLLDGEAGSERDAVLARLKDHLPGSAVVPVDLAPGMDPGGLERGVLWGLVAGACREKEINLDDYR